MAATCVICLEDLTAEDKTVHIDGCDHIVHSACFFAYAKYKLRGNDKVTCPMCRHIVIDIPPAPANQPSVEYRIVEDENTRQDLEQERKRLKSVVTLCVVVFGLNALFLANEIFMPQ